MVSLRRKPAPTPDVDVDSNVDSNVAPAPVTPPSDSALKQQLAALRESEQRAASVAEAEQRRAAWLSQNRQAQENYSELDGIHQHALKAGLVDTSPAYFEFLNSELDRLQTRQHRPPEHLVEEMQTRVHRQPEPPPQPERHVRVSAPPSRDPGYGSSPTSIRLTKEQSEFARMSGISEADYAKELLRLNKMKAEGHYQERR